MFSGSITALITPFNNGKLDEKAFQDFVSWQIEQGSNGLVPVGTTGESPTLSHAEHKRVIELCVEVAKGRVPVIAGAGSNSTETTIEFTHHAKQAGADAVLIVSPYYNKPTQNGIFEHYKTVHDSVDIPIVVYNIPGRSVIDIQVDTMAKLAKLSNIIGVKDATQDLMRPALTKKAIGNGFCQLSGEDGTVVPFLSQGGHGCISVTSNIAPKYCADLHKAWIEKDIDTVTAINEKLIPLHQILFCESSPSPVKYAASLMGLCQSDVRLPLCQISEENKAKIQKTLEDLELLK